MAGLTKHPLSPYWTAIFYDGAGAKVRRSTKLRDRRRAMETALAWERAAKDGREKRLTEAQARKVVGEILERSTGEKLHFHTFRAWLDEWLAGKNGTTAPGTLTRYKQVLGDFIEFLGERAKLPLPAISPADVRAFRDKLAKEKRAPSTVNLQIKKVLNAPFAAAFQLGYIPLNPCAAVEALRDDTDCGREMFTAEQVGQLVQTAEGDWRGAVLAGYFTGLRLGDVANLKWEAVDFGAGVLRVRTTKTKAPIVAPLHPEFEAWLKGECRGIAKAPVFPALAGKRTGGAGGLSAQFAKVLKRAGIARKLLRKGDGAGHRTSNLSFHSLRHTFVSALANAGVAPELRQKLSGHADEKTHALYTHHEVETLRAVVAKLPGVSVGG